jgi:multiple sugar transport system permease protein
MAVKSLQPKNRSTWPSIRKTLSVGWKYLVLCLVAVIFLLPFYWLINSSLKTPDQVLANPPVWFPKPVMWRNYVDVLNTSGFPFFRLLRNTVFYAGVATFGMLLSCSFVAYGFARLEFWGRDTLFAITLATMMLPGIVTLIPTYLLFRWLGWVGSYAPLIIPHFFGNAFNIFLLRQFFLTLPWELSDAARVDGAGELRIYWQIMLPLVRPALLVAGVFQFMGLWNDFMGPLIYLDSVQEYPLVMGLAAFRTRFDVEWNLMLAASLLTTAPLIVIFFIAQRYIIEGVTLTGLKG